MTKLSKQNKEKALQKTSLKGRKKPQKKLANSSFFEGKVLKAKFWGLFLAVFALVLITAAEVTPEIRKQFLIESIAITGVLQNLERDQIEMTIAPLVAGDYFTVDLENIKSELEELSWINSADVRRIWPNALLVHISEKKAIAQWQRKELISVEGENFAPENIKANSQLPLLSGPEDKAEFVMNNYHQMNRILRTINLNVKSLHLEDRYSWKIVLDNQITVRVDTKKSLEKLQNMVSLLKKIPADERLTIKSIDLRYENGLALRQVTADLAG